MEDYKMYYNVQSRAKGYVVCVEDTNKCRRGSIFWVEDVIDKVYTLKHITTSKYIKVNKGFLEEYFRTPYTSRIIDYKKTNIFDYLFDKLISRDTIYFRNSYYKNGMSPYHKEEYRLEYDDSREQYDKLFNKVMLPYCEIYHQNEALYLQVSGTVNSSLKLMERYFIELDDEELTEEVDRLVKYVEELVTLNEDILSKSDGLIVSEREQNIIKSITTHKQLLDEATEVWEKLNKH